MSTDRHKKVTCHVCNHTVRSDTLRRHMKRKDHIQEEKEQDFHFHNLKEKDDDFSAGQNEETSCQSDGDGDKIGRYAWKDNGVNRNHHFLLPRNIRAIVCGKSGVGKTCLVTYLLLEPDMLDYDRLYICGKSLHQPEYKIMKSAFSQEWSKSQVNKLFELQDEIEDVNEVIETYQGKCKGGVDATFNDDPSAIPDPSEHDPKCKTVLLLDDLMLGPQSKAEAYYTRGRHNSVDTIYITQSYFRLPRQTVRENANFYIFFPQDNKNLSHIFQDHCAVDGLTFSDFRDFCSDVWNGGKHNFVTIDLTRPPYCGKYRKNLDDFWIPKTHMPQLSPPSQA